MIWGRADAPFDALCLFALTPVLDGPRQQIEAYVKTLRNLAPDRLDGGNMVGRVLSDDEATSVIDQWNNLPAGNQARCHVPRHGLATWHNGQFDWFASICFECSNVYLGGEVATEGHRIIPDEGSTFERLLTDLLSST